MTAEEEIRSYKILLETARCLGRAMDLSTLTDNILDRSKEVMRAEACGVFLPDAQTGDLILHSTEPRIAGLAQALRIPAGQGLAGVVFSTKQTLNVKDAQQDSRHYQAIGKKVGCLARALISVPLLDGDRCLGVLQAMNPRGRDYFDQQDEQIFEGFGGLIVNALLRLEAQHREIERAQTHQELLLAREIQESFLPTGIQELPFARVHLSCFPAELVGGDFYFVQPLADSRVLVGLGDVSGKGIPAALTMARATAIIKGMVNQLPVELGEWVTKLNRQLVQELKAGRFVAMTFLLADATSSTLQICAAGQFPPLRYDEDRWDHVSGPNQLPLGVSAAATYQTTTAPLKAGDFWMLFSDGIAEARNVAGEELTSGGFMNKLPVGLTAAKTMAAAIEAWRNFLLSQHDDASFLLLDWRGLSPSSEFTTTCSPETLCQGRAFVESWAKYAGYDDVVVGQIVLACDEAVSNIFRYGYDRHPGPLRFQAGLRPDSFFVWIADEAQPVDIAKIKPRELSDVRPGGLGTFIMTQVFDQVRYESQNRGTVLKLEKSLP